MRDGQMIATMAAAMRRSRAWPAVFGAGTAEELARVAIVALDIGEAGAKEIVDRRNDLERRFRLADGQGG